VDSSPKKKSSPYIWLFYFVVTPNVGLIFYSKTFLKCGLTMGSVGVGTLQVHHPRCVFVHQKKKAGSV
jgi:hypothetical protein